MSVAVSILIHYTENNISCYICRQNSIESFPIMMRIMNLVAAAAAPLVTNTVAGHVAGCFSLFNGSPTHRNFMNYISYAIR